MASTRSPRRLPLSGRVSNLLRQRACGGGFVSATLPDGTILREMNGRYGGSADLPLGKWRSSFRRKEEHFMGKPQRRFGKEFEAEAVRLVER